MRTDADVRPVNVHRLSSICIPEPGQLSGTTDQFRMCAEQLWLQPSGCQAALSPAHQLPCQSLRGLLFGEVQAID